MLGMERLEQKQMDEIVLDKHTKLYKRNDKKTDFYYCCVKSYVQKNKVFRSSTKETDLRKATAVAKAKAEEIYRNETFGAVVVEKTFNFIAKQYFAHTLNRLEKGLAKSIEQEYISIIENKFLPFFGDYNFNSITQQIVEEYVASRTTKISRSRQQTEQAAWNALQKYAINNGFSNKHIDFVKVKVSKAKDRLSFSKQEQQVVRQALTKLRNSKSKNKLTNELNELLHDYYYFLLHSAIRVGREFMRVRYSSFEYKSTKHLSKAEQNVFAELDENEYLVCYLKEGETKTSFSRQVIIRTSSGAFENALLRIASRCELSKNIYDKHKSESELKTVEDKRKCLKDLFENCDEYVLRLRSEVGVSRLSDNAQLNRMKRLTRLTAKKFNELLNDIGLYSDKDGNFRSLYSIRHTYASELLEETNSLVLVANQLGNSAVILDKFYNKADSQTKASAFVGMAEELAYKKSSKKENADAIEMLEAMLAKLKSN